MFYTDWFTVRKMSSQFEKCFSLPITHIMTWIWSRTICGFQSVPGNPSDKDVAAMLVHITIEANEESFINMNQQGGIDMEWNLS